MAMGLSHPSAQGRVSGGNIGVDFLGTFTKDGVTRTVPQGVDFTSNYGIGGTLPVTTEPSITVSGLTTTFSLEVCGFASVACDRVTGAGSGGTATFQRGTIDRSRYFLSRADVPLGPPATVSPGVNGASVPVPEPATWLMLLSGIIGVGLMRRMTV